MTRDARQGFALPGIEVRLHKPYNIMTQDQFDKLTLTLANAKDDLADARANTASHAARTFMLEARLAILTAQGKLNAAMNAIVLEE